MAEQFLPEYDISVDTRIPVEMAKESVAENVETQYADPVQHVYDCMRTSLNFRQDYEDSWDHSYEQYRSYRDEDEYVWKSNIFVPYTFSIIESVVPKMLGSVFNTKPIVTVTTRKGETTGLTDLLERILDYQLEEESMEFYMKLEEFFKDAAIYGTSFAKIQPKFKDDVEMTLDFIDFEPIDLFDVFPDPRATSIKRAKWIIQRSWIEYEDLLIKQEQGIYENVDQLEGQEAQASEVDRDKQERLASIGKGQTGGNRYELNRKLIEIWEYWDEEKVFTIGASGVLLREEDNPFNRILPFIMMRYVSVPHELYGIGIPEMCESLQEELNNVRNQRMDNVNIVINRMFVANKLADIDFDNLLSYPGNVILTNDMDAVQALPTPDVTTSAYQEEEVIKRDMENATGEWEYSRGATPPHRETATGIIRLQQAANVRFDNILKNIEFGPLRDISKMFLWLDHQFLDPATFAEIVGIEDYIERNGDEFFNMEIEDVLKLHHFQPVGSSTTAIKELRTQQIFQAFSMFNGDPYIDQFELRKMVLQALDIKSRKLLKSEEQIMQEQMAMAAQGGMEGEEGSEQGGQMPASTAPTIEEPPMRHEGITGEGPAMGMGVPQEEGMSELMV